MPINIGNTSIDDIYIGSTPIDEIRIGSELIWSRAQEETYHTLTVDFEGESKAFEDGYRIYVDDDEKYRAYASDSTTHSFNIPAGSSIWTVMEPYYIQGMYSYSETITPVPTKPWIMDTDYSVKIVAKNNFVQLTIDGSKSQNFEYALGSYKFDEDQGWKEILDNDGDYHLDHGETVSIPKSSEVSLYTTSSIGLGAVKDPDNFVITEDTTVYFEDESYGVTITTDDRIESVKIFYRATSTDEWQDTYISEYEPFIGDVNCQYYLVANTVNADYLVGNTNLGSEKSPLVLTGDFNFNIWATTRKVTVTIKNPFSDYDDASDSITVEVSSYDEGLLKSERIVLDKYSRDVIYTVDVNSEFSMHIVTESWDGWVTWNVYPSDIVVDNESF
jgi:hypothetical protein